MNTPTSSARPAPASDAPVLRIDRDRLWSSLMELKEIGGYDD